MEEEEPVKEKEGQRGQRKTNSMLSKEVTVPSRIMCSILSNMAESKVN